MIRLVKRSSCAASRRPGLCESSRLLLLLRYRATTAPDESRGRPRADDCNLRPRHAESDDRPPLYSGANRDPRASPASSANCARLHNDGDRAHPVTNDGLHPVRSDGEKSSVTVDANCVVRTTAAATWRGGGKRMRNRGNVAAYDDFLRQSRKVFLGCRTSNLSSRTDGSAEPARDPPLSNSRSRFMSGTKRISSRFDVRGGGLPPVFPLLSLPVPRASVMGLAPMPRRDGRDEGT